MWNTLAAAAIFVLLSFTMGCTRGSDNLSLKLSFNSSSSNSAQSVTGKLDFAVINVQLPSGPIVKEFEFEDNPIPAGQEIILEVPNVPKGAFLVQFLGIYKNDGEPDQFVYGDANAVLAGANMQANITAAKLGTFASEGRVSGRYLTESAPEKGPTGTLVMQFQPPNDRPKMNIHASTILDGWFSIMALDGVAMDYMLLPSKEILFKQVKLQSGSLYIDGTSMATGNHLLHIGTPASFRYEYGNDIESRPASNYYIGYFQKTGLGLALSSSKKVCYPAMVQESVPGYYRTNVSGVLSNPVEVNFDSGGVNDIRVIAGGVSVTESTAYTSLTSECPTTNPEDRILVYHTMLGTNDDDKAGGIAAPFVAIRPFSLNYNNFLAATYASNTMSLSWKLLPALSSVSGYTVFYKYWSNGGGGGGGIRTCADLAREGYIEAGSVNNPAATSYDFTNALLSYNTRHNFDFAVCAYQTVNGTKSFIGEYITGRMSGSEGTHSGWANSTRLGVGSTGETYVGLGGGAQRVMSVDSSTSTDYTELDLYSSFSTAQAGDEVMISIVGMHGTNTCGTANGDPVGPGTYGFARVLYSSSTTLKISKGSFIDQIESNNANIATDPTSANFCYVQVSKVLQFRDLNLSSTTSLTSGSFSNYGSPGGVLPLRVNGTLTLGVSTVIDASSAGFAGGTMSNAHGAGVGGPSNGTTPPASGGQGSSTTYNGSGGAGSGYGGAGTGPATQSYSSMGGGMGPKLLLGGGGGNGGSIGAGGAGGGVIFINARKTQVTSTSYIKANGQGGSGSGDGGGGGGGGSIVFMTGLLSGTGSIDVQANGGSGGNASAGVGGGGNLMASSCQISGSASIMGSAIKGSTGSSSGAGDGMSDTSGMNNQYMCQMIR